MQWLWHHEAQVTINVPVQVALARQNFDCVVVGGVDGAIHIYDHATGELVYSLGHKVKGRIQVVDVIITSNFRSVLCNDLSYSRQEF